MTRLRETGAHTLIAGVGLLMAAGFVLLPGLTYGPSIDAAVFAIIGERLLAGEVPYRDLFDHKPPGIYLYSAIFQLAPTVGTWTATWIGSVVALFGAGVAAWLITVAELARRGGEPSHGHLWPGASSGLLLVAFLGAPSLALGGGMTEQVGALPALGAVWAADIGSRSTLPRAARWSTAAGAAAAFAVATSFFYAPVVIAAAIILWGSRPQMKGLAIGLVTVPVVLAGWLLMSGALPAAVDALTGFNAAYLGVGRADSLDAVLAALAVAWPLLALATLLAFRLTRSRLSLAIVAWSCLAMLQLLLPGRFYAHYLLTILPPLALLAGLGLVGVEGRWRTLCGSAIAAIAILAMVRGAGGTIQQQRLEPAQRNVGRWLDRHTEPAHRILVWDRSPQVYLTAGRAPAGRFIHRGALMTPGYGDRVAAAWLQELEGAPPAAIVVLRRQWGDSEAGRLLRDFVEARYELARRIDGRRIFVPREAAGGSEPPGDV